MMVGALIGCCCGHRFLTGAALIICGCGDEFLMVGDLIVWLCGYRFLTGAALIGGGWESVAGRQSNLCWAEAGARAQR